MTGPTNAIVGDLDSPLDLPETQVKDEFLQEEKRLARYSKTKEFKRLKEYFEGRIKFFQTYLPNGDAIAAQDPKEMVNQWVVANLIIGEFKNVLNTYENAKEVVSKSENEG